MTRVQAITINSPAPGRVDPFTVELVKEQTPDRGNHPNLKFTPRVLTHILNEIASCGVYYKACAAAGVSLAQFNRLREVHPEIKALVEEAKLYYQDLISHTVHNRAIEGWDEPVFYQGRMIGTQRKFSDRLLELQAKRHCPEYRDKSEIDVKVAHGVLIIREPEMSQEEWLAQEMKRNAIEGELADGG